MIKRFMVVGLLAGMVLAGCAGVTPSVEVGVAHRFPGDADATAEEIAAWWWSAGGSLKASFAPAGVVLEPCGGIGYTRSALDLDTDDESTTSVPATFCLEIDTGKLGPQ